MRGCPRDGRQAASKKTRFRMLYSIYGHDPLAVAAGAAVLRQVVESKVPLHSEWRAGGTRLR